MGFLSESNIRFLDRENESQVIRRFMVSRNPGILGVHGPGGIGKTVLLWWTADECTRQGILRVYIDLAQFPFTDSVDVMKEVVDQLDSDQAFVAFRGLLSGYHSRLQKRFQTIQGEGGTPPADLLRNRQDVIAAFVHGFQRLPAGQPVVLLFDNRETVSNRQDREYLENDIFSKLSKLPSVKLIVASRAQVQWRNPDLNQNYRPLPLYPFEEHYGRDLTSLLLPELLEREPFLRALKVSGGHPYSVVRLARTGAQWFDLGDGELYQRLMEELWANVIVRFMLKGIGSTLQEVLSQISIVRFFDMSGLRYFSQRADLFPGALPALFVGVIDTLNRDVGAIRYDEAKKGYQLQLPIRPVSLELHRLSQALEALNRAALDFYLDGLEHLPPGFDEWRRCVIEVIYHRAVLGGQPEEAKAALARALSQLRARKNLEAAIKLRDEFGQDWDLPATLWQDIFAYFEERELRRAAA
jgi:hypothetical protein